MSIRILSERKKEPVEGAPPKNCSAHLWLAGEHRVKMTNKIQNGDILDLYLSKRAEAKIRNHALSARNDRKEVMGFLLGELKKFKGITYVIARDVVTTELNATNISVRFDRDGFENLFASIDDVGFDYVIVGWYHSHPGHGCFMSKTDVYTQKKIFNKPWHFAIVIDPILFDIAVFALRDGKMENSSFAVYWRNFDDPYGGLIRLRK